MRPVAHVRSSRSSTGDVLKVEELGDDVPPLLVAEGRAAEDGRTENDGLHWPHFDALKWPHLRRLLVSG